MATYDAFEADVAKIQGILEEVQTIEEAVTRINTEISEKANAVAEYTEQAKGYRDETKQFRDGAYTSATNAKASEDKAKVSETNAKVSETNAKISEENAQRVAESLPEDYTELSKAFYNTAIKQKAVGDNIHVTDSAEAKQVELGLYGKATQDGEPTPDNPIEITVSGSGGSVEVVAENEDSTQRTTANIPTPNGLCGIKVSSGGNYTDENGQQWITDEIVKYADGSGERIQRVTIDTFVGKSSEGWLMRKMDNIGFQTKNFKATLQSKEIICNKYINNNGNVTSIPNYSCKISDYLYVIDDRFESLEEFLSDLSINPLVIVYRLAEPIRTPLTAEQLAEIEKLHTFYPVTNISNDADCGMSITYMADAKRYIDQRLALIESAMLNNI
jgi:hypothetical protein